MKLRIVPILLIAIFLLAGSAWAITLNNTSIGHGIEHEYLTIGSTTHDWYTEYYLYADEFKDFDSDGWITAFCVENVAALSSSTYELLPVPTGDLTNAAIVASQFLYDSSNTWSQTATQIAIWELVFETDTTLALDSGYFKYSGEYLTEVNAILTAFSEGLTLQGPMALAHSPRDGTTSGNSQDYLVGASVPDASLMWLLSPALIALGVVGRRRRS